MPGLPLKVLCERLHYYSRQGDSCQRALAFYLLDLERRNEVRTLGYKNAVHYASAVLSLTRKEARELLRVARRLEELEVLDDAFARSAIAWSKLREITRIATPDTEAEWLEFARRSSARAVELAVANAKRGDRPKKGGGLGTPRTKIRVQFMLSVAANEVWKTALGNSYEECGEGATLEDAVQRLAETALGRQQENATTKSTNENVRERKPKPICTVIVHKSRDGRCTWIESEDGPVAVDPAFAVRLEKGVVRGEVEVLELEDPRPGIYTAIQFGERGSVPHSERDDPTSETLRRATLLRDGERCFSCGSRKDLAAHHILSRADGGESRIELLVTTCASCHGLLHEGLLKIRVEENGRVTPLGREGLPLFRGEVTREFLEASTECPLPIIERVEPPTASARESVLTFDDLPAELSASEWHVVGASFDWSPSRRAYVLRPEADGCIDVSLSAKPRAEETAPGGPTAPTIAGSPFRPETLDDFVGEERVVENLTTALHAAKKRGEPLGHVLLSGPAGLGKTSLARLVLREAGRSLHTALGGSLSDSHLIVSLLTGLEAFDVLFIDEIHALKQACAEALYTALEDRFVDVVLADGSRTRTLRVRLEPFTLIGATTELGSLEPPLRSRFAFEERLRTLEDEEIVRVVEKKCPTVGRFLGEGAAPAIASRSRGVPREAVRLLLRARDVAELAESESITREHVERAAEMLGIDRDGLSEDDRRVLEHLLSNPRPVGIQTIAAALSLEEETLRSVIEPYLLRKGYIARTPRGRIATRAARAWLERRDAAQKTSCSRTVSDSSSDLPLRAIPIFRSSDVEELRRFIEMSQREAFQ